MEVDFIVVDSYSPYRAIVARPWLHALRAISSTLHQKVKYLSHDQAKEILESQSMARQCMVAALYYIDQTWSPRLLLKGTYSSQKIRR